MKNKRILCAILALCMVAAMFTGCGKKSKTVIYDYDYDLSEYIKIGDYIGIEYTLDPFVVEEGSKVSIDYEGYFDGEQFEGGTGSYDLTIGSGAFIPGFEDGLIGYTVGDKVTLDLTFPEEYKNAPEKSGQPVTFNVTINAIDGYTSDKEIAEEILWNKYFESCEILKYPDKEMKDAKKQQYDYYKAYATNSGVTFKTLLKNMDITEEEFEENVTEYAEQMIAQDMALYALARAAGIEASDEAIEQAKSDMLAAYQVEDEAAFKDAYGVDFNDAAVKNSLEMTAILNEVLDMLVENAVPASV